MSLEEFLQKEKDGQVVIHSWYDENGTLCLDFTFADSEAEYLADLLVDCMEELVPEVRQRHEQQYEGQGLAGSLLQAAEGEE